MSYALHPPTELPVSFQTDYLLTGTEGQAVISHPNQTDTAPSNPTVTDMILYTQPKYDLMGLYPTAHPKRRPSSLFFICRPMRNVHCAIAVSISISTCPEGSRGYWMSAPCLESLGCHWISLYYLFSCSSAQSCCSFCFVFFFLINMAQSPAFFLQKILQCLSSECLFCLFVCFLYGLFWSS